MRRSSSRSRCAGAGSDASARRIGLAIANSPLVKTAIAGGDANWGRVIMAVGKSGEPTDMARLGVAFGGHEVARAGAAVPDLDEAPVAAHLAGREIAIEVVGRRRAGRGHGVDLRPDARLHRHQCRLPLLSRAAGRACFWSPPARSSMPTAGCWWRSGRPASRWRACGSSRAASSRPGETPEACLIRELHEELGVDTETSCLAPLTFASHAYDGFHLLMPLYVCRVWRGEPAPREGQALRWLRPNALRELPMPAADLPLIPVLEELL